MKALIPYVPPLLTFVFIIHAAAFAWLYRSRKKKKYMFLVGTFLCLTVLYALKTFALHPALSLGEGGGIPLAWILRAGAAAFTICALAFR